MPNVHIENKQGELVSISFSTLKSMFIQPWVVLKGSMSSTIIFVVSVIIIDAGINSKETEETIHF